MAPSQLKQLKASLREKGVVGPQQSKKQRQKNSKSGAAADNRIKRNAALQAIREQFNPFEVRAPARPSKFAVTTARQEASSAHRPGVTRGLGEERRKQTLLKELQSRNKVGGLLDRRFGENDPSMTPEQRAAERYARESQKRSKKEGLFNLEDDEEEEMQLTHMGQSLFDVDTGKDDFNEDLSGLGDESDSEVGKKRKRILEEVDDMDGMADDDEDEEDQPERKKSKNEVMKEIIAKSKQYKYERQKSKEDDNELRAILDQGLPDVFAMMRGTKAAEPKPAPAPVPEPPQMDPDRAALLGGKDRDVADREYDQRLKQMAFDKRSKPSDRTKTQEEKIEEEAKRLQELENERLRRMRGEEESDEEQADNTVDEEIQDDSEPDDAKAFGLAQTEASNGLFGVEDEDDFIIDDDLVDNESVAHVSITESEVESEEEEDDADDTEFIGDLELPRDKPSTSSGTTPKAPNDSSLAFTYPCPESHDQFLQTLKGVDVENTPVVVQRIRALHHASLHPDNKAKLGEFSKILVDHAVYLANQPSAQLSFTIIESLLRHVHSMAKTYPEEVATRFRAQLRDISENRPLELLPGDLVLLTGIATIFPTSDHFHAVVTPSILTIGRYLGQGPVNSLNDIATGSYIASLCLQYQAYAKRYIPEFMNFVLNSLTILAPKESKSNPGFIPVRTPEAQFRLKLDKLSSKNLQKLRFWDIFATDLEGSDAENLKLSLINILVTLLDKAVDLWGSKLSSFEIFEPASSVLQQLIESCPKGTLPSSLSTHLRRSLKTIKALLITYRKDRRPLLLHNHRPLAIKSSIPKFEESFNPDRHYDPDRERAELSKLKAEHKRERKGAMRELRKDANFIARESLREKKERDAEYEKKYRRLVAEIQGEEGREAKLYEKEKKARKQSRK
ncbi:nucleolar complex protein 14 [Nannizzia gypsea CBS 118893]|uniref:Nucleolar complex protein 14 n=1 Tax=Arthroderma gypseum (strain ATCC MYA-4604 / CBS 118893) TaxID=535722 RepID=E4UXG4_ARTGP|nr:nucleolar complex protein 14 [Nannizzia gypsea CBS 118893]EFR01912.1 nucleolar complex protein 14 [Nannizzia gypsea CBS 118893]